MTTQELSHPRTFTIEFVKAAACLALLIVVGCGDDGPTGPPRVKTVQVTGKVLVDGGTVEPPKAVRIRAHTVGELNKDLSNKGGLSPTATANPDGTFTFSTYETGDGVPVGDYTLTFQLGQPNMMRGGFDGDDLNGKYMDPVNSEHKLSVPEDAAGPIDLGTIELSK